ncbi:TrbG/VirB9 family P-type conjugative transfer protein [Pseudacidobacterium ailaaui]|uniref:TrbG/VirB9 family P-type conjugative transfer protein n=1 Tax=Pseudacidobacterium ailaaui TaxID=1382359 RepID=UPI00047BB2FD|nr:TrbG/VirB9 family P-type conjugative transfer protein [Pseudacidobacterium ailaaui]MDI3255147.1 TrbG/VirB9 family P-type conjugative transfer protein [Bacillota bacterium]
MKHFATSLWLFLIIAAGLAPAGAQMQVEKVPTALDHFSTVVLPPDATVVNVAVGRGPADIQVQYHDRYVLVKPLKPGIRTNMAVFTENKVYNYEISPAGDFSAEALMIREYDMAKASAQQQKTVIDEEIQKQSDQINTRLLMSMKAIDGRAVRKLAKGINVRLSLVGQDAETYFVRFSVINNGNHGYRLEPPRVWKIDPAFGINMAYSHMDRQLSEKDFRKFRAYQQTKIEVRTASIERLDLGPDQATEFVIAMQKPAVTPAIFRFLFPSDDGIEVSANAIF